MRKVSYIAIFEPCGEGYSVYFPDLPGCISYGDSFPEARREAEDALGLHLYGMEKDGEPLPVPARHPQPDPETAPGYLVSVVTVYPDLVARELDNRRVKTNVTLPAWLTAHTGRLLPRERNRNPARLVEEAGIAHSRESRMKPVFCLFSAREAQDIVDFHGDCISTQCFPRLLEATPQFPRLYRLRRQSPESPAGGPGCIYTPQRRRKAQEPISVPSSNSPPSPETAPEKIRGSCQPKTGREAA